MATKKYLARVNGVTKRESPVVVSAGSADAGKILAVGDDGRLDETVLPLGIGAQITIAPASEGLDAGNFVNLYADSGVMKARKADNSNGRVAHGFVKDAVLDSADASVYALDGVNGGLTGLSPGDMHWLGTAGGVISTPLDETSAANDNKVSQQLGIATSATELRTDDYGYVVL